MIIPFYYFFFTIGITGISEFFFRDNLYQNNFKYRYQIPILPIATFIFLLIYCSLSNLILLFPLFIRYLGLSNQIVNNSTQYFQYIVNLSSTFMVIYGIVRSVKILKKIKLNTIFNNSKNLINNVHIPLLIAFLIYYLLAPKNPNLIMFDTGYYHYPAIKFLSKFGIETGIGSFFSGYGVYNLQFFGQLPFHNIFSNLGYISPSINIIFLAIYIWFFISEYFTFKNNEKIIYLNVPYKDIVILYFFISCLFCSSSFISTIASYSPNIPIFICGSVSFYIIFSSTILGKRYFNLISIILLTIFAPLLKTSAITICLLNTTYLILYNLKILKKDTKNKSNVFRKIFYSLSKYFRNLNLSFFLMVIITTSYLVAMITNVVQTGYVVFPSSITGPIGDHAVDPTYINNLKEGILSWHRYSGDLSNMIPSKNFFKWFPYFIKSRNGIIAIIYWITPLFVSLLLNYLNKQKISNSEKDSENIIRLNNHVLLITIFAFLNLIFLIPAPSYTPWLTPVIIFLLVLSYFSFFNHNLKILKFRKYTLYFVFSILIIGSLKFSFSNQVILKNLFEIEFITKFPDLDYKTINYKPKKWSPLIQYDDKTIDINVSESNQCWNIPAPCITKGNYKNLLK